MIKNIIIGIASLAAGALLYPAVSSTASAVSPIRIAAEECAATVYGQCVEPEQSEEEIATACNSPCGCAVVIDIASSTVTYVPTECPPEPAPSQEIPVDVPVDSSPYPTSSPEPDVPACQ